MQWYKVFSSEQAMQNSLTINKPVKLTAGGKTLCLVMTPKGVFAFHDACPHMRFPLHQGRVNPFGEIVCALHSYRFNMETGEEAEQRGSDLNCCPLEWREDGLYVGVE
ncbi:MAG: Rieske 2Fe-2S domain-containing protein [Imperialibacter sp.]